MKRSSKYWLPFALVIVPAVLIGGWAFRQFKSTFQRQEEELRSTFRSLCADAAQGAMEERLRDIRGSFAPLAAARDEDAWFAALLALGKAPFVETAFLAGADGRTASPFAASKTNTVARSSRHVIDVPDALLAARRLEFVGKDLPAAAAAYQQLAAHEDEGVREEARQGLLGCRVKQGKFAEAADQLTSFVVSSNDGSLNPEFLAVVSRDIAAGLEAAGQSPRAAGLLLDVWEFGMRTPAGGANPSLRSVDESLNRLQSSLPEQDRGRYERLTARQRWADERATLDASIGEKERAWLIALAKNGPGPRLDFWSLPDLARIDVGMRAEGLPQTIIARLNETAIADAIGRRLEVQAGLRELAANYHARYGKPITPARETVTIPTPWSRPLAISFPNWPVAATARRHHPLLWVGICLVAGVLSITAGMLALAKATRKDLALVQLKSDFVSNVSHELKTPLSLVRMFGEMLDLGYAKTEEERKEYYRIISKESERLTLLINNILDFARIEKGERTYRSDPVALGEVVREVLGVYQKQLETAGFVWRVDAPESLPEIAGDRTALAQAFLNLLSNAMKYSDKEKQIDVVLSHDHDDIVLSVQDRGIGIPTEEQKKIFEKFYRVEAGLTRTTRGSGLGLTLVKHIVEGHGGRVEVASAVGEGSTFRIVLPVGSHGSRVDNR